MGTNSNTGQQTANEDRFTRFKVPWVHHDSGNPRYDQLVNLAGLEGYGRFWLLVEMVAASLDHFIPTSEEQGFRLFLLRLGFETNQAGIERFEDFVSLLIDLGLAAESDEGLRTIPMVDASAAAMENSKRNGAKGGKAAAANRRKQARQLD